MKGYNYNFCTKKNAQLREERSISFEDIIIVLEDGCGIDVIEHPNYNKYPNQKMFVVNIDEYVYLVPFLEEGVNFFLKTIFPSRKMTREYLEGEE